MELFGVSITVGNVLLAAWVVFCTIHIYDWLAVLAWRRKYKLHGYFPLPFFGTFLYGITKPMEVREKTVMEKFGPVVTGSMPFANVLYVGDVELLKKIFIKEHVKFQNRFSIAELDPPPMDHNLLSLKDQDWKRVRSRLTPAFSVAKIKLMTNEMKVCSESLVQGLEEKAKEGAVVDSKYHFGCYSMDVIASAGFGIRTDSYNNPEDSFVDLAKKVFGTDVMKKPMVLITFFFPTLGRFLITKCGISSFYPLDSLGFFTDVMKKIIQERKETNDTSRVDLLQLMLNAAHDHEGSDSESRKGLSTDELLAQGFLAFIAGYETTATLLTSMSYVLAVHPDVQDKLREEINSVISTDEDVTYERVFEMSYLDQVVCETLRMYPPVIRMNRTTSNDQDVNIDGHWFPRNTLIGYSAWQIHYNPEFYPEPEVFKPERFSPEEKAKRDPFVFIPFGQGPRNCIGMRMALLEAKIAMVQVLRKIKFTRCPETEVPMPIQQDTFLRAKRPIKVGVELL